MKRTLAVALATALILLIQVTAASAVEIGSRCTAEGGDEGVRVQTVEVPGGPTYTAPISGILTQWGTALPAGYDATLRLKIVQATGTPGQWSVVRQSDPVAAIAGANSYATRIAIAAGERIAVYSATYNGYCTSGVAAAEGSGMQKFGPDTAVGGTFTVNSTTSASHLALFAVIEPDADGDGYGDQTQDACSLRADMQTPCPAVKITGVKRIVNRTSLKLAVMTDAAASLVATASVRLPARNGRRARTVKFKRLVTNVEAGRAKTLKLKFPKSLASHLKAVSKKSKVKVRVKLAATGLVNTHTKNYSYSLRGRR